MSKFLRVSLCTLVAVLCIVGAAFAYDLNGVRVSDDLYYCPNAGNVIVFAVQESGNSILRYATIEGVVNDIPDGKTKEMDVHYVRPTYDPYGAINGAIVFYISDVPYQQGTFFSKYVRAYATRMDETWIKGGYQYYRNNVTAKRCPY